MNSYMAFNGSCIIVTWTDFKNHFLEVGLTQNRETMALQTLTTIDFIIFVMPKFKSRDHEIVRAQKKVSKGCLKTPLTSCSVITDPQV